MLHYYLLFPLYELQDNVVLTYVVDSRPLRPMHEPEAAEEGG